MSGNLENIATKELLADLNEKQKEAVVSEAKRLLVLAGAGAGKTKTIIQRILFLILEKNVKPSKILAITFTRNAANEMLDRLIAIADQSGEYENKISSKSLSNQEKVSVRKDYLNENRWVKIHRRRRS